LLLSFLFFRIEKYDRAFSFPCLGDWYSTQMGKRIAMVTITSLYTWQ